jgi:hypothetical protein
LLRLGISRPGADQVLTGRVVADSADRARLARLIVLGFTPQIGSYKGSFARTADSGGVFPAS